MKNTELSLKWKHILQMDFNLSIDHLCFDIYILNRESNNLISQAWLSYSDSEPKNDFQSISNT